MRGVTPIASSTLIRTLGDLQERLAWSIDANILSHPPPGPKDKVPAETIAGWRSFPRSCDWYDRLVARIADISATVGAEQAVAELVLLWLPPAIGAGQPGAAFNRSQFDFAHFTGKLRCLSGTSGMGGVSDRKELAARQQEEARNAEVVSMVMCVAVCDVLAALLTPRPERRGPPLDPEISYRLVQLAFGQFNPHSGILGQMIHPAVATTVHRRMVISWSQVVCHLARSRFDQIVTEFTERLHSTRTADDVFHILVGVQRITIPSLAAPAAGPFLDQYRQLLLSEKRMYKDGLMRLCVLRSLELLVRQCDCGADDVEPHAADLVYSKLQAMFVPLLDWSEKADLAVPATQVLALMVCQAPAAFWQVRASERA